MEEVTNRRIGRNELVAMELARNYLNAQRIREREIYDEVGVGFLDQEPEIGSVVENAAATDCGKLVPITHERDTCTGLIGDDEQGVGGVLVEHPGFVDDEQVPGAQDRARVGLPDAVRATMERGLAAFVEGRLGSDHFTSAIEGVVL